MINKILKNNVVWLLYASCLIMWIASSCKEDYSYNTNFAIPTELISPEQINISINQAEPIILKWTGGGAADGSVVLYEVYFDKEIGDFSEPFHKQPSDLGSYPQLTLTHTEMNAIARKAGINPGSSGSMKWTVRAAKGGNTAIASTSKVIRITRPEMLDIPANLYIFGTAIPAEDANKEFWKVEDGTFVINTEFVKDGNIWFASSENPEEAGTIRYYYDPVKQKLCQGTGTTDVEKSDGSIDITLNFNQSTYLVEEHFDIPERLYLFGDASENGTGGQAFRKENDGLFVIYTKLKGNGNIYFSDNSGLEGEDARNYYINPYDNRLYQGDLTTAIAANPNNNPIRITVNFNARNMNSVEISEVKFLWSDCHLPVDASKNDFAYTGNGEFRINNASIAFLHRDDRWPEGQTSVDARYLVQANANGSLERWGCKLTKDVNTTVSPYERKPAGSDKTFAEIWTPDDNTGMEYYEMIVVPWDSAMPGRWYSNWFFRPSLDNTEKDVVIYTNREDKMYLLFE